MAVVFNSTDFLSFSLNFVPILWVKTMTKRFIYGRVYLTYDYTIE